MIGVAMLLRHKAVRVVLVILAALLLALVLFTAFSFLRYGGIRGEFGRDYTAQFSVPLHPEAASASLKLDIAAARVRIGGETGALLEGAAEGVAHDLDASSEGEHEAIVLRVEPASGGWRLAGKGGRVDVALSDVPVWRVDLDCGASSADLDLSGRRVEDVRIDAGASAIRLRLGGEVPEARVHVQAGVSSIRLEVPETVGCEIRSETGLSSRTFKGFRKETSGLYRTENFHQAGNRILIDLSAGISSIRVGRYL